MYKCHGCGKQFQEGVRLDSVSIWEDYVHGKLTHEDLSVRYHCSPRTIRRHLSKVASSFEPEPCRSAVVIMDTTYFGRRFGVMLFQDALTGRILHRKYVKNESNALYLEGLDEIRSHGTRINGVVCDGHKNLLEQMGETPAQMCQFHFIQIIRRKLTPHPRQHAGRELLSLCKRVTFMDRKSFAEEFGVLHKRWGNFIEERTIHKDGKRGFLHRRLRGAYLSTRYYLPWLFTCTDHPDLGIPNTTNRLEGTNSELKRRLHLHNGLTEANKKKFIDGFLEIWEDNPDDEKRRRQ